MAKTDDNDNPPTRAEWLAIRARLVKQLEVDYLSEAMIGPGPAASASIQKTLRAQIAEIDQVRSAPPT